MLTGQEQLEVWKKDALDPRPRAQSGWTELDSLLRKQSFGPGTLAFLAGRLHTRKTAVAMNLVHNMLQAGVPVGLVGLDEAAFMYVAKLASVLTGISHLVLDEWWHNPNLIAPVESKYLALTDKLSVYTQERPTLAKLGDWLEELDLMGAERPRVVFIDYLALLERDKFAGRESTRIPRLCEDLQVWTNTQGITTIALHQVGRMDDNQSSRYHGHRPITPEQLMYGGEQQADIIMGTYRPSLDPVGQLTWEEAEAQGMKQDEWQKSADRVLAYEQDTMLQLVKNRPGTQLCVPGIRLRSKGDSQKMEVVP